MIPDPHQWLSESNRSERITQDFESCRQILIQSSLLRPALIYWIRLEVSNLYSWQSSLDEEKLLDDLESEWQTSNPDVQKPSYLRNKLRVRPASIKWAEEQWSNQLESLYLSAKINLDQASCYFLRIPDKGLITEFYYRIKASEANFDDCEKLARETLPDLKPQKTFFDLRPLSKLPAGIKKVIPNLQLKVVSKPLRIGDEFCIIKLEQFNSASFDSDAKNYLIAEQLRKWLDLVADSYLNTFLLEND